LESGTVDIESAGEVLTNVSHADVGDAIPRGVTFPFGTISFDTSVNTGGTQSVRLTFSESLPQGLVLYKVDTSGEYTKIPTSMWKRVNSNTVELRLTDGGRFDLDGVANGVVVDPVAIGSGPQLMSNFEDGGGGCAMRPDGDFDPLLPFLLLIAGWATFDRRRRESGTSSPGSKQRLPLLE